MFKRTMWMLILIIILAYIKAYAQSPVIVMNPIRLAPHTTAYVIFDGTQPIIVTNFDYLIASQFGLSRSTQTDVTNSKLNDIYTRQSDSSTHKITVYQGDNPWIMLGTATIANLQEVIDALNGVSRSTQTDITNSRLLDIFNRTYNMNIASGTISVDNLNPSYKNVVIDSGNITVDGSVAVTNQYKNIVVDSGSISVDNLNPSYKNIVVDSGTLTVNTCPSVWITSGIISIDNLNPSYYNIVVDSGTIVSQDERYTGYISSGTGGLITAVTSAQIAISDYVYDISFLMKNASGTGEYAIITCDKRGQIPPISDGDSTGLIKFNNPINNITFYITMPVTSTITYNATTGVK